MYSFRAFYFKALTAHKLSLPLSLTISVYTCVYTHSYIYTHICLHTCVNVYIHTHIIYIHIYAETLREREFIPFIHTQTHIHTTGIFVAYFLFMNDTYFRYHGISRIQIKLTIVFLEMYHILHKKLLIQITKYQWFGNFTNEEFNHRMHSTVRLCLLDNDVVEVSLYTSI